MSKKLIIIGIIAILAIIGTVVIAKAIERNPVVVIPSGQTVIVSNQATDHSPALEKIEFIHWKKNFARLETAKAPKLPTCYKFLTPTKVKWTSLPVSYVINPANPQTLAESFICEAIINSVESEKSWDKSTSKELFKDYETCPIDHTATYGVQDYRNAIIFGNYPTAGVIAVTTVWYNPATKSIVEFDIEFDTDWIWGDVTANSSVMDLQNIATHEFGHGVGLADVYDNVCNRVTMYGYSDYGETIKRTLEQPDITGLRTLYGN